MSTIVKLLSLAESVRNALIGWMHKRNFDLLDPKDLRNLYIESDQIIADIQQQSAPAAEQCKWHHTCERGCLQLYLGEQFVSDVGYENNGLELITKIEQIGNAAPSPAQEKPPTIEQLHDEIQSSLEAARHTPEYEQEGMELAAQEKPVEASVGKVLVALNWLCGFAQAHDAPSFAFEMIDEAKSALATASSPSEDTKRLDWARERLQELRDNTAIQRGSDDDPLVSFDRKSFIEELDRVLAAMSSPSVTQTETETSPAATTRSAQERQSKETGDA